MKDITALKHQWQKSCSVNKAIQLLQYFECCLVSTWLKSEPRIEFQGKMRHHLHRCIENVSYSTVYHGSHPVLSVSWLHYTFKNHVNKIYRCSAWHPPYVMLHQKCLLENSFLAKWPLFPEMLFLCCHNDKCCLHQFVFTRGEMTV